jgi:hypothetical protein
MVFLFLWITMDDMGGAEIDAQIDATIQGYSHFKGKEIQLLWNTLELSTVLMEKLHSFLHYFKIYSA